MSHTEKNERRRQNGGERKGNGLNGNVHKTRSERYYRDNFGNGKKSVSPKSSYKGLHRTNSQDQVRRLVEQEGRTARNLVTWSVPVSNERQGRNARSNRPSKTENEIKGSEKTKNSSEKRGSSPGKDKPKGRQTRSRSNSANRKKIDLRARYWSYLFDNLKRAVDEIYTTCETDESVMECQEVIMMLEQCRNDFQALIERIQLHAAFEKADSKDRPQSLAWTVRKLSPGKNAASSPPPVFANDKTMKNAIKNLDCRDNAEVTEKSSNGVISWADRVKGKRTDCSRAQINKEVLTTVQDKKTAQDVIERNGFIAIGEEKIKNEEDSEGWETVRYSKKNRSTEKCDSYMGNNKLSSIETLSASGLEEGVQLEPGYDGKRLAANGQEIITPKVDGQYCEERELQELMLHQQEDFNELNVSISEKPLAINGEDEGLKGFLSPLNGDSDVDTDGEDGLTASDVEHQKAISAAIEQEEDLSKEIEKEEELFYASAKEHKEKLEKEIADQEALVNAMAEREENNGQGEEVEDVDQEDGGDVKAKERKFQNSQGSSTKELTWEQMVAEYDEKNAGEDSPSWGDIVENAESRPPGRAVQMHKKLSSPSRKRGITDGVQKHAEKQAKAQQLREQLLDDKLQHLQTLSEKVEKVRELKMMLIGEQENHLREKQRRAEEKRKIKLKEKVRKAQEEEAKVNEIAFIMTLEAQNKKMEVLSRHQDHEARMQDLQEERQRKRGEQQAKEAAAYERRKQLEAERQARLEEMRQKRQEQEAKFLREKQEKEKAREEAAKEKAREREQRLAARNEALQTAAEQLQLKIKQKQQESTKRHEQMLEFVKEKAAGTSRHSTQDELPTVTPYERKKICTLCNVPDDSEIKKSSLIVPKIQKSKGVKIPLPVDGYFWIVIVSEVYLVSHLRGKKHQQAVEDLQKEKKVEDIETLSLQYIKEIGCDRNDDKTKAGEERKSAFKKRAKKIRTRMAARGREYEATLGGVSKPHDSSRKSKLQKVIKDLDRYLKTQSTGPWAANRVAALERSLGELNRMLEGKVIADQVTFCYLGGLSTLSRILLLVDVNSENKKPFLPSKTLCSVVSVMTLACAECSETSWYLLLSNKLSIVVDLLAYYMTTLCSSLAEKKNNDKEIGRVGDLFVISLQRLLSTSLLSLITNDNKDAKYFPAGVDVHVCTQRVTDLVSYVVCTGIVDNLQTCFSSLFGSFDNDQVTSNFVLESLETLVVIARYLSSRSSVVFDGKRDDSTQFMITVKQTGLVGIITLLYSVLLSDGLKVPSKIPEQLSEEMDSMATKGLRFLNYLATADLNLLQTSLGCEGVSLQFRHILGHTLRVCSAEKNYELLHEVILIIGYFTVLNPDNQVFVQSGRSPTLLQKLCSLPFQYFSNPRLRNILFPTLICSCYQNEQNKEIVEQEVSCALLNNYLEDQILDLQQEKLAYHSTQQVDEMSKRMFLSRRFPINRWKDAQEFLHSPNR